MIASREEYAALAEQDRRDDEERSLVRAAIVIGLAVVSVVLIAAAIGAGLMWLYMKG